MALTTKAAEKELNRLEREMDAAVQVLANRVREEKIAPLCRRRGWTFMSGMGTWSFYGPPGRSWTGYEGPMPIDDDKVPRAIRDLLDLEVGLGHGQVLGFWVSEVE
jgi:hypothetical protein